MVGVSSADNLAQNNPVAGRLRISVAALRRSVIEIQQKLVVK